MPPLRGARAARANRGQTDVDIMEGLPVRQWRKQPVVMNKNPQKDAQTETNDQNPRWRELPMPKGSDLYPPWSQALLRAARAGRILQRSSGAHDEDKEGGEDEDADGDLDASFTANRWNQLPKEAEEPETEFLAKRRKGLPTLYGGWATDGGNVTMRKCKIKKFDAEGNPYLLEVLIPETTTIDGEIEEPEDIPIQAPPAGTVVEGLGIANAEGVIVANEHMMPTPPRRRPPIPKRKPKGPGRGRKKKIIVEDGTNGTATAVNAAATAGSTATGANTLNPDGTTATGDAEGSVNAEGDADGDGDDGSDEDDDDGEDGDDNDREDGELSDADDASRSASPVKAAARPDSPRKTDISGSLLGAPPAIPELQVTPAASDTTQDPPEAAPSGPPAVETQSAPEEPVEDKDVPMTGVPGDDSTTADGIAADIITTDEPIADVPMADAPTSTGDGPANDEIIEPVVEATKIEVPEVEQTAVEAEIPENHNPLEGLTEPQALPIEPAAEAEEEKQETKDAAADKGETVAEKEEVVDNVAATLVDAPEQTSSTTDQKPATGEDDIFGSLERHLDGKDKQA